MNKKKVSAILLIIVLVCCVIGAIVFIFNGKEKEKIEKPKEPVTQEEKEEIPMHGPNSVEDMPEDVPNAG